MATALPPRDSVSGTYPNPSNATARAAFGQQRDYLAGTLGESGTTAEARSVLGIGGISYRNKLINGRFAVNQLAKTGTVTLAAGVYGHDGWKAGAGGCTYTFAKVGNLTTITISSGTLIQIADGRDIDGGNYVMSWGGSAQGRIAAGGYASNVVTAAGVTAAANLTVEFGIGTLTNVQLEEGTLPSVYEKLPPYFDRMRCLEYFQTSYQGQAPGTVTQTGRIIVDARYTPSTTYAVFGINFAPTMRATPTLTIYNPANGAAASIYNESSGTNFAAIGFGSPFVSPNFASVQTSTAPPATAIMTLHYTADARL